ncbi:MAG TPA: hypothetical protein VF488_01520 [Gemmatimonadaceae bacterium]
MWMVFVAVGFVVVYVAARRFEAEQRRNGRWDENGPIFPTQGPWGGKGKMGERLEVTGQYVPRPIPRELPAERDRPPAE